MSGKKWILSFVLFSLIGTSFLSTINYVVDPFGIFHTKFFPHQFQRNERFLKIEFLEQNNKKFNGYMLGSSRIGTTSPSVIEKYIPNSKLYNFTMNGANIYDYLMHIKYFVKKRYPIETLYLQLDLSDMQVYGRDDYDYLRKLHPYVLDKNLPLFYIKYLTGVFPINTKGKIDTNINYKHNIDYNLETGMWSMYLKEKQILKDCKSYIKKEKTFNTAQHRTVKYITRQHITKALSEIVKICNNHNIKLYVFVTPHNKNMMDTFNINDYFSFLKDISTITDFYDFSGYNSITVNNCNYYESSHYRPLVGALIAAKIFKDTSIKVPTDFGAFITLKNIDKHLEYLKKQIIEYTLR